MLLLRNPFSLLNQTILIKCVFFRNTSARRPTVRGSAAVLSEWAKEDSRAHVLTAVFECVESTDCESWI